MNNKEVEKKVAVKLNTEDNAKLILALATKISKEHAVQTQNSKDEYCIELFSSKKVERAQIWLCSCHVDIYVSEKCALYNLLTEEEQYKRGSNVDTKQRIRKYTSIDDMKQLLESYIASTTTKSATDTKKNTKKNTTTKKNTKKKEAENIA